MGILDQAISGLMGDSPLKGIVMNLLAGRHTDPATGGGLRGLIGTFEQAGLGQVVQSWVGTGPNRPVSPGQLRSVFGDAQVQGMAKQAGLPPQDFLSQLSQHLPQAVDRMTPNGKVVDDQTIVV